MAHKLVRDSDDHRPLLLHLKDGPKHLVVLESGDGFVIQIWSSSMADDCDLQGTYTLDGKEARALVRALMG
jgi:hypothetical protein